MTDETITISVTQEHIDKAIERSREKDFNICVDCIINQAVKDHFKNQNPSVVTTGCSTFSFYVEKEFFCYELSKEAKEITDLVISQWKDIKPFTFEATATLLLLLKSSPTLKRSYKKMSTNENEVSKPETAEAAAEVLPEPIKKKFLIELDYTAEDLREIAESNDLSIEQLTDEKLAELIASDLNDLWIIDIKVSKLDT